MTLWSDARRRLALVGVVGVIVIVGGLATMGLIPFGPRATATATPLPSFAIPGPPASLEASGWWRLNWRRGDEERSGLVIGTMDGKVVVQRNIGGWSPAGSGPTLVRGPVGGLVLVAENAPDRRVNLTLTSVKDGSTRLLIRLDHVYDAQLGDHGRSVYVALGDRPGEGVWRLATDGSGDRAQLLPPDDFPDSVHGGIVPYRAELAVSTDERTLVQYDCASFCLLRSVDLTTHAIKRFPNPGSPGRPLGGPGLGGLAGHDVDLVGGCFDLASGTFVDRSCLEPELTWSPNRLTYFQMGVELPSGWRFELQRIPNQGVMEFEMQGVAIEPNGRQRILPAIGTVSGQG